MNEHGDAIRVKPKEKTLKEQKILEISAQVYTRLKECVTQAITLTDFIWSYYGLRFAGIQGNNDWMWDDKEPTKEEVFKSFREDMQKKEAERDAKIVQGLAPALQNFQGDPSTIQMILKRIRDRHGYYQYGVLAKFPKGIQANNPELGQTPLELIHTHPDVIFFRPITACVLHACDDLYKLHRNSVFEIPYQTREQAILSLQHNENGANEYQLKKTVEETVKQNAGNYITVGLQSAFSNEPYVVPVSRF